MHNALRMTHKNTNDNRLVDFPIRHSCRFAHYFWSIKHTTLLTVPNAQRFHQAPDITERSKRNRKAATTHKSTYSIKSEHIHFNFGPNYREIIF